MQPKKTISLRFVSGSFEYEGEAKVLGGKYLVVNIQKHFFVFGDSANWKIKMEVRDGYVHMCNFHIDACNG